jgi:hypothetical protein
LNHQGTGVILVTPAHFTVSLSVNTSTELFFDFEILRLNDSFHVPIGNPELFWYYGKFDPPGFLTYVGQETSPAEKAKKINSPEKKYACSFLLATGVLCLMKLKINSSQ